MRRLRRSKGTQALLEGPHLIGEALGAGLELRCILATPGFLDSTIGRALSERLPFPAVEVEAKLLDELADSDSPRGIVAAAHLPRGGAGVLPVRESGLYVYLEGIQHPGNLGALVRAAEASGATGVAVSGGSVHPNHPRALRASAGSLLRLPVAAECTPEELRAHLADVNPRWTALVPRGGRDPWSAPLEGTLVVALGAEGPGLSETLREISHQEITIPLASPVESLNVTVAAAVVLFEIRRRRYARLTP